MTVDQREKIQDAVKALIDVESALQTSELATRGGANWSEVQRKLGDARHALVELNAPEYN